MPNFTIAPDHASSRRAAAREYVLDMLQQLAQVARAADEIQIAILLDAVVKAEKVGTDPNDKSDRAYS